MLHTSEKQTGQSIVNQLRRNRKMIDGWEEESDRKGREVRHKKLLRTPTTT